MPVAVTSGERRQRQLAPIRTGIYVKAPNGLRLRSRKVRRLVGKMHAEMPWLAPADLPACRAWAEMELLGPIDAVLNRAGISEARLTPSTVKSVSFVPIPASSVNVSTGFQTPLAF